MRGGVAIGWLVTMALLAGCQGNRVPNASLGIGWEGPGVPPVVSGTWQTRAELAVSRSGLAAAAAGDEIYAFGGASSETGLLASTERYDPTSDTWTTLAASRRWMCPRRRWPAGRSR